MTWMNVCSLAGSVALAIKLPLVAGILLSFGELRAADGELDSEQIYDRVSPCVALISDIDTHGSGVVLERDGLILTNYHVVASGISLSVSVDVKEAGKVVRKTFDDVEVWKVHPKYDLALLKVDYSKGVFAAARPLGKDEEVATGSTCFAIGNPGGADEALEKSITEGLVSSAKRKVEGLDYIQISAAINPGNSGGAVANAKGQLIGIATWKLDQSDNIGFAIPIQAIDTGDFIAPGKREVDYELGKRYEQEAHRYGNLALRLEGEERILAIQLAAVFYRKCLELVPNDPAPYSNLGTMYFRLKEDKISRKYLEAALKLRPDYAASLSMLGIILERSEGEPEEAMKLWFKGVTDPKGGEGAGDCAENLAISYFNTKKYPRAAYCIRWADALATAAPNRMSVRRQIWETSAEHLSEAQFAALKNKTEGYSAEDLEDFSKGEVAAPASTAPGVPSDTMSVDPKAASDLVEVASEMVEDAVEIPEGGIFKPLPAVPTDIIPGYAGGFLIMKFDELKRLGVFDLSQAKFVKYINLDEKKAVVAAGGKVLLIYYPEAHRIDLWDMVTWEKKVEKMVRSDLKFSAIGMGLMNHKFALAIRPEASSNKGEKLVLLSIPDCQISVPEYVKSGSGMGLIHFFGHMGDQGRIFVEESGSSALVSGSGRGLLNLANPDRVEVTYHHGYGSSAGMIMGGSGFVSGRNEVYLSGNEQGKLRKEDDKLSVRADRTAVAPVWGYRGFAELVRFGKEEPMLRIRSLPQFNVTFSAPVSEEIFKQLDRHSNENSLFASAYVKRCAFVDRKNKKVALFAIDKSADAVASGPIAPGADFRRKLEFAKGTKASIDSGPKGLLYDADKQEIRWSIPADQKRGTEVSIIFLLVDADGNESFHIEKIVIP